MSPEAMKAVFDNLTSGAGRRVELEYKIDSATHCKADPLEVSVWSMRLSTQMHIQTGLKLNMKTLRSKLPWTGVTLIEGNPSHRLNS